MSDDKIFHIGVMIGNVHTQHPMELIRGICEAAKSENVNITFFVGAQGSALEFWNGNENDLSAYNYQYNSLYDYSLIAGLDAIIISYGTLCIYLDQDDREAFASKYRSVPLVILEEYDEASEDSFIISDNFGSMYNIVDHLLSVHGYKKVLLLSGPKNNTDANERERAYLEAMKEHGLTVNEDMIEYGDYSSDVDDLVERLLDNNPDAEAIVAANDEMAVSIYRVLRERGLIPGRDIAVTGYDDVEFAQRMDPPLTTANQDGLDMGYRALKCAVRLCKNPEPVKMKLPAKFLQRQSCGCKAQSCNEEWALADFLEKIENGSDAEHIEDAVRLAAIDSYQSIVIFEDRKNGMDYFSFLINMLFEKIESGESIDRKEMMESALSKVQDLCRKEGMDRIDHSGFLRAFHQVMQFFMGRTEDKEMLVALGTIIEITDAFINSFTMRNNEDRIMFLLNKSWAAPATIRYMIDKVDDENAFNYLAIENAKNQGAKSAYIYLLPRPLNCSRKEEFTCPDELTLVAEYTGEEIKVYGERQRPVITKEEGFAKLYPSSPKHTFVAFMLFAKTYQYGIMICEINAELIGLLYGTALQISTAMAYMQISKQENETKRVLYNTLKELRDKNQVLSFVSSIDALTGLYNRRGFMEGAVNEANAHIGSMAAIFFSDLDHLKQINDEFGHMDGDFALTNASRILKETIMSFRKEGTICGRIGGDEFVSFMIIDDEAETEKILKALKDKCKEFNDNCDKPYYVEFSTGCTTFKCAENYSVAEITEKADECLYEAKKSRRENIRK